MKVNIEKGYIYPVSLIKKGMSLNGIIVDDVTIDQIYNELKEFGVPVYLTHAPDPANRDPSEQVAKVTGIYKDVDGLYGSCQFYKSFMNGENTKQKFQTLIEVAQNDPTYYGFSLSFFGPREDTKDGKAYRAEIVASADLVNTPAANPQGLLSVEVKEEIIPETPILESKPELETIIKKEQKLMLTKEQYEKIKTETPEYLDNAIQLSFEGMEIEAIYKEIFRIKENARMDGILAENIALKAKVDELVATIAELNLKLTDQTQLAVDATSQVETLSLKVTEYEKKKGASAVNVGFNTGEKLSLKQKMETLPTFSEKLAFYRANQSAIDAE